MNNETKAITAANGKDTAVQVFQCEQFGDVRTATINDKPYFMLADVCRALDIKEAHRAAIRLDEKGRHSMTVLTNGGKQQATFISEGNVYRLAFTSRKPEAERFVSWVCDEVIPAIRQNGYYLLQSAIEQDKDKLKKLRKRLKELNGAEKRCRAISDNYDALKCRYDEIYSDLAAANCRLDNIRAVLTVKGVFYPSQWNEINHHVDKIVRDE